MPSDRPSSTPPTPDTPLHDAHARLALHAAGMSLWEWDVPAGLFTIDARFAELLGRPELTAAPFDAALIADMTHPEDRDIVAAELSKVLERDEYGFETMHRGVKPDGAVVWLHARAAVTDRGPDGAPLRVVGVVENCTERQSLTAALEVEKRRADLVLEASGAGVWDWHITSGHLYWSPQLRRMLGVPADADIRFDDLSAHIHTDDWAMFEAKLKAHLEHGASFRFSMRMVRSGGAEITVRVGGKAERNRDGEPVRMAGSVVDITGETQAQRAAAAAEARAGLALGAAGMFLIELDLTTGLVEGSVQLADLLGRAEIEDEGIEAEDAFSHIHADDFKRVMRSYEQLVTGARETLAEEFRVLRSNGEERWVLINTLRPRKADGSPGDRLIGVVNELTERKRAELALAAANDRFERAVESSLIAIWDWDIAADRVYWSRRMYEVLGLDPETERIEMIGDITPMVHPDDLDALRMAQARHFEHGAPFELEYRMIRADGVIVRLFARGAATRDADGAPVRFVGSLIDVTAQHAAEAAARISGARAQYALEAASLGLWEYDAHTGAIAMDARLASLLGRPELADSPLDQDTVFKFTAKEDLEAVKARFVSLNSGEVDVVRSEHRIVDADGRRIWILAHIAAPERDDEGRPTRLIGITQDLTARKAIEDDLRNAKERAEAANAAKSAFLATMSHEIRTPLNGVLGMAQLLTLSELDDKQRRYTETILSSGRSLAAIIDDVLDISRIEAGRLSLKLEATRPAEMMDAALEPLKEQAQTKGLVLTVELETGLEDERLLDPVRMGQVLRNLIANAIKFTPAGQVQVRAASGENNVIRFEVEDEGPGITPDLQASIFERFTQADMSTQRAHGGAGLGLAIARELTELAGGRIGVESEPGAGAVFWFEIPAPRPGEHPVSEEREGGETIVPDGASVLVVEDHPVNRAATAELLACAGFEVREADTADAALAALQAGRFDAVLLDLHMPGRGGDSVLTAIRRGEAGPADMPAFLLTADATPQARDAARDLKADGYFVKPAGFDDIRRRLAAAILRARG